MLDLLKGTEVRCDGAVLVAGFHNANPPLVWRFDLDRNHSFALTVQGDDGDWVLGVISPRGDFTAVAHFELRADADAAMGKLEKILARRKPASASLMTRLLSVVGLLAIVILLAVFVFGMLAGGHKLPAVTAITPGAVPVQATPGAPQSADDVLTPPSPMGMASPR